MTRARLGSLVFASLLALSGAASAWAQSTDAPATTTPPSAPAASVPTAPATPAAPAPATPAPAPATPAPAPAPVPTPPSTGDATKQPPDTSISQTLDLPARPALVIIGKSSWDDGFKTIMASFAKLNDALVKNKITGAGHPLAVFTETDDNGFSFSAEIPLDKTPEGTPDLPSDIKTGETPGGKAMRFQHRGSYEEIDSTYEAITAYLDEKGLEARNLFAEEYLDQVKTPDDGSLEVDIYVFLK